MKTFAPLFLLLAAGIGFAAEPSFPLHDGELLSYRVSFAILRGAGNITIEAHHNPANKEQLVVTAATATRGFARMLFSFDAKADSTFDLVTGKLLSLHEFSQTRGKEAEHTVTFDYPGRRAVYTARGRDAVNLEMPSGDPTEIIMALLQTRSWGLKPGEQRDALVLFDDDFYELTLHAVRYEQIHVPLGDFNTLVLEPRMEKTPPKGMFKRGSSVRVWIAQDAHRLPVRFDLELGVGTGSAVLESYQPAGGAAGDATTRKSDAKNPGP